MDIDPADLLRSGSDLVTNPDVELLDAFKVDFLRGRLRLRASSLVGIIPLNESVVLDVRPRVPIANLTRMVQTTGHKTIALAAVRGYAGSRTPAEWAMDLYAEALIDQVDEILNRGLYRTYARHEEDGSFPKGRIDFRQTIARHASRDATHKVAYRWFERSPDCPPNRCIKAALLRLHTHLTRGVHVKGYRSMVNRIAGQLAAFDQIILDRSLRFMDDPEVIGLRPLPEPRYYYRDALDLAVVILKDESFSLDASGSDVRLRSILIDMNDLFENYVRIMLAREARRRGWILEVLDGNKDGRKPLYERPHDPPRLLGQDVEPISISNPPQATPDIVLRAPNGSVLLVAEVKNTAKGGVLPERSEVEQAVTYAQCYRLDRVLIVRPLRSGTSGLIYCGRVGSIDVFDYKVDLGLSDQHAVAADFATTVERLMPDGSFGVQSSMAE